MPLLLVCLMGDSRIWCFLEYGHDGLKGHVQVVLLNDQRGSETHDIFVCLFAEDAAIFEDFAETTRSASFGYQLNADKEATPAHFFDQWTAQ